MAVAKFDSDAAAKFEAIQKICLPDKQLDEERDRVLRLTRTDLLSRKLLSELLSAIENVHVGWIFSSAGKNICRKLSLALDNQEPGWQDLATKLGLSLALSMDIKYDHKLPQGPTYTVLCIYAHKDGATIGEVLEGLHSIKRSDVLNILKEDIIGKEGLIEMLRSEAKRWNNDGYAVTDDRISRDLHPFFNAPTLPPLPFKHQEFISEIAKRRKLSENIGERPFCTQRAVGSSIVPSEENSSVEMVTKTKKHWKAIVMLTFSVDGLSCANRIASALREKHIGVLILNERRNLLESNPEMFIAEVFPQVNYVIPIVTEGYLDTLTSVSWTAGPLTSCADARYVKLIYTLMATQYLQNGCINLRVRCIIPDGNERLMQEHPVVRNRPVLQAWLPEREIEVLADSILSTSGPRSEE